MVRREFGGEKEIVHVLKTGTGTISLVAEGAGWSHTTKYNDYHDEAKGNWYTSGQLRYGIVPGLHKNGIDAWDHLC